MRRTFELFRLLPHSIVGWLNHGSGKLSLGMQVIAANVSRDGIPLWRRHCRFGPAESAAEGIAGWRAVRQKVRPTLL
jgi:hypothetical protein